VSTSTSPKANDTAPSRRDIAVERSITKARARAEERSTLLIDAALDLVAERKSLEFTVQEVVDRTKLSLHAFYQLFASKDALVEAVLEESLERGVVELRRRVDEAALPIDRLRAFVVGYFELATESRHPVLGAGAAFTEFSVHLDFAAPAKAWDAYRPLRILAYELLRAAIDDGSIRADLDPDLVAAFLLSSVRTVTEITIAGTSTARPTGEQLWQLVADGVTPLARR
jgi:AcrR family transcriptional regulator